MILNKIKYSKRRPAKLKIVKPPKEREKRASALSDIVVFDSTPFGKSLVEEALFGGLHESHDGELEYP
jgi:hypothetical protein